MPLPFFSSETTEVRWKDLLLMLNRLNHKNELIHPGKMLQLSSHWYIIITTITEYSQESQHETRCWLSSYSESTETRTEQAGYARPCPHCERAWVRASSTSYICLISVSPGVCTELVGGESPHPQGSHRTISRGVPAFLPSFGPSSDPLSFGWRLPDVCVGFCFF
jgi:hypothetical protein